MENILSKLEISELERLNKVASPAHWIPLDLSQALKKNEDIVLIVELRNKAGRLIDMAKQLLHTEKWYAIRLRQLRDLCEKHNLLTEFCNIVANGKENHTAPPTYQNIVNQLEYELEQYKKKERDEMSKSDLKCHCGESGYYHCSELRNKIKEMRDIIQIILEADALKEHAYDRGDDDASIYDLCKAALKFPGDE